MEGVHAREGEKSEGWMKRIRRKEREASMLRGRKKDEESEMLVFAY